MFPVVYMAYILVGLVIIVASFQLSSILSSGNSGVTLTSISEVGDTAQAKLASGLHTDANRNATVLKPNGSFDSEAISPL